MPKAKGQAYLFTPGPWYYIGDNFVGVAADCDCPEQRLGGFVHEGKDHVIIGHPHEAHDIVPPIAFTLENGVSWEQHVANCKLIAQAPEMLARLEAIMNILAARNLQKDDEVDEWMDLTWNTIGKATGRW